MARRPVTTYSAVQILLHWLIVILIVTAFLLGDQMKGWERLPADAALPLHGQIGLTVFFLMLLRVVVRLWRGAPPPPETDTGWQRRAATWSHVALYVIAIILPWSGGFAFYLRSEAAAEVHEILKVLLLLVAGLHTVAALYHQFYLKDGLMQRMGWPGAR